MQNCSPPKKKINRYIYTQQKGCTHGYTKNWLYNDTSPCIDSKTIILNFLPLKNSFQCWHTGQECPDYSYHILLSSHVRVSLDCPWCVSTSNKTWKDFLNLDSLIIKLRRARSRDLDVLSSCLDLTSEGCQRPKLREVWWVFPFCIFGPVVFFSGEWMSWEWHGTCCH